MSMESLVKFSVVASMEGEASESMEAFCPLQVETVLTWPFETNVDSTVRERLESMIQMDIENDDSMMALGELSPVEILLTHSNTSERRLRWMTESAEGPGSGIAHARLQHARL